MYKSINNKNKKKDDKKVLLAISRLNNIEVLLSRASADSNISHEEVVLISNVLKGFYDMKEKTKNYSNKLKFKLYIKQSNFIV